MSKQKQTAKKKRGRPCTVAPEVREQFLVLIRAGNYRSTAAQVCGVTLRSISRFMTKTTKEGREFRRSVLKAESQAESNVVGRMYAAATAGDMKAIEFFLARKYPERWSNNVELLRETNRVINRLEQRLARGVDVDKPRAAKI